ncbi:MAG: MFS transporter [Saprospiraceae bacterium]|jgi:MFS family permease|nr:MFS transporter [Saprospiraceae bacterium]MBK6477105.1 MFS transporter [Saprospiraceae bacterium]MBK7369982.1 MFS transporter [Saprospiraceae bacterium]MBK7608810.1 MFS transporter [Saprospiraceae bacterium]MBK8279057.1 MFS transporter [Saprospiraceae bacterium]
MDKSSSKSIAQELSAMPVIVAALGYLVDMYDLFLFSIVRVPSLKSLNLSSESILNDGILLLNLQMAGLLVGGIFWGILGDKKGRLSVLFGSILIYSLANIGNGFVHSVGAYAVLRFIAGFGLAGELGAGITLVTEILPNKIRGYGTTLVATLGVFGALLAYVVSYLFDWRASYFIGGGLGLLLLVLRVRVFESGIFMHLKETKIKRGDILMLFNNKTRFVKYLTSILIGMPIWFVTGILITFSPEFGRALGLDQPIDAGKAVLFAFAGQVVGNIISGGLSQYLQSRKKVIGLFMAGSFLLVLIYLLMPIKHTSWFYILVAGLGFFSGYWALFITVAAELFGSNIRATVATTVPNFVRGTVIPLTALFVLMKSHVGTLYGALVVGAITYLIAMFALFVLEETFKKDINYTEDV